MNPTDEKGEISNEFFKKLNQQIVQKDNLIKLLQLQIRNLKSQVEEGGGDKDDVARLESELESKIAEADGLKKELTSELEQAELISKEKDEQIQELNRLLENQETQVSTEIVEDSRVQEMEEQLTSLSQELESERASKVVAENQIAEFETKLAEFTQQEQALEELRNENELLRSAQEQNSTSDSIIQDLRIQEEANKVEVAQLNSELATLKAQLAEAPSEIPEDMSGRVMELEQDIETLKNLLAEKDDALLKATENSSVTPELEAATQEIEALKSELQKLSEQPILSVETEAELNRLREENSSIQGLTEKIDRLEMEAGNVAELAMKVTALESEREQLQNALEETKENGNNASSILQENEILKTQLNEKEEELAKMRVAADSGLDQSMSDPEIREEVEHLTQQVADQLLSIQNFEGMLREAKSQLEQKDAKIAALSSTVQNDQPSKVISISEESDIITGFIDFFDGLDSVLTRNPIPELQVLHQRLLDQLIIPNQIAYVPVVSEEFNETQHVATDYFRSDKFDEKCIVFEVEKGYRKADLVVKKSKVWVVQNLFNCTACGALQSNPDSRFCHLCGAKIVAPNGLPVDSLPEFEPTATTYLRFAERMLEKGDKSKAKEYLEAGLKIDSGFVPLMVMLGEIHAGNSAFAEAIEILSKACAMKPNPKIEAKIKDMEVKQNIFKQAQTLKLSAEEFDDLVHIIQK